MKHFFPLSLSSLLGSIALNLFSFSSILFLFPSLLLSLVGSLWGSIGLGLKLNWRIVDESRTGMDEKKNCLVCQRVNKAVAWWQQMRRRATFDNGIHWCRWIYLDKASLLVCHVLMTKLWWCSNELSFSHLSPSFLDFQASWASSPSPFQLGPRFPAFQSGKTI